MFENDEVFYKICFDSLIEGLCITNREGRIIMNNTAFDEIFGYDRGSLIGKPIDVLIPEGHRLIHHGHFKTYFKAPKKYLKGKGREFKGLHRNGNILDLEIGLNYFEHEGELYAKALVSEIGIRKRHEHEIKEVNRRLEKEVNNRTIQLTSAITELEKANKRLTQEVRERIIAESKAKSAFAKEKELNLMHAEFLSLAAHEFKTPLSGILTSASLIEKYFNLQNYDKIGNHSNTIKRLVYQLNSILDDFLFAEKVESGKYKYEKIKFRFCELMADIMDDARTLLKPGQTIEVTPCQNPVELVQDKKVIDIIIRNVLYNAIKYSPEDSVIRVKLSLEDEITVVIEDEGIGIPEEALEHVFDRFFRAKNALHIQGTGIGLNIVKWHLDILHGNINIKSVENKGTRVVIQLPILADSEIEPVEHEVARD